LRQYRRHEWHVRRRAAEAEDRASGGFRGVTRSRSERPRLQHADGPQGRQFPILERKRRTLGRVNDEIMATIIATRREAGLDALPKARAGSRCRKSNSAARADEAAKT
jgi:hypothetical protein